MAYLLNILLSGDQSHGFFFEGGLKNLKFNKSKDDCNLEKAEP